MTEIGDISRPRVKMASPGTLPEGKVGPGVSRVTIQVPGVPQARLPFDVAVQEVARAVTSYIASNKLALQDAYTAYVAEFYGELPMSAPTAEGVPSVPPMAMTFIEGLSTALLTKAAENPYSLPDAPLGLSGRFQFGNKIVLLDDVDTLNQVLEKILAPAPQARPFPAVAEKGATTAREPMSAPVSSAPAQKLIAGWKLNEGTILRLEQGPLAGITSEAEPATDKRVLMDAAAGKQAEAALGTTVVAREAQRGRPASAPGVSLSALTPEAGTSEDAAGRVSGMPDRLRIDLTGIFGGRAELTVRYDAAVITSKVAVLLEQVNSLVRATQAQASMQRSSERAGRNLTTSLEKAIDSILSLVISQNNEFRDALSLGITMGKDRLLALDPATLKAALETNREEAITVLRANARSFQEQIGMYVDPRLATALTAAAGDDPVLERTRGRGRKNRWEREREGLEKRMLELGMLIEYSEGLRDWFQMAAQMLKPEEGTVGHALVPLGTMLPARDLRDEDATEWRSGAAAEGALQQFVQLTTASLDAESGEPCIKLLLKRRAFVETFRDAEVQVGLEIAELCFRNEELVLRRLDEERRTLFSQMEELSRNIQVTKGYAPHFPFPPMPAFISSRG